MVKNAPEMQETGVQSLGQEDPLEDTLPTPIFLPDVSHEALLPGESHGRRSLIGYSPWGCKQSDTTEQRHFTSLHFPGGSAGKQSAKILKMKSNDILVSQFGQNIN